MTQSDPQQGAPAGAHEMSLGSWSREVWRRRWVLLLVLLLTVNVALLVTFLSPKTYEATSAVKVSSGDINPGQQSSAQSATLLGTQVEVLQSSQMASDVAQRLDEEEPVEVLDVVFEPVPESQVARITVTARTAEGAARVANTYALAYDERRDAGVVREATSRAEAVGAIVDALAEELATLQAQVDEESNRVNLEQARITVTRDNAARAGVALGPEDVVLPNTSTLSALQARYAGVASELAVLRTQLRGYELAISAADGGVAIVSAATEPTTSSSPGPAERGLAGAALGLALGVALAILLALRDRRLYDEDAVRRAAPGTSVLATVRRSGAKGSAVTEVGGLLLPAPLSPLVDVYRGVGLAIAGAGVGSAPARIVTITDVTPGSDATAAAGALAVALARTGSRVLLVDARESVGKADPRREEGLTDVLTGDTRLSRCLVPIDIPGEGTLSVLAFGRQASGAIKLNEPQLGRLLVSLAEDTDVVIIRTGSLLEEGAASVIVPHADMTVLPVLLKVTRGPDLHEVTQRVQALGGTVSGVVVHEAGPKKSGAAAGDLRQGYRQGPGSLAPADPFPQSREADAARNVSNSSRS